MTPNVCPARSPARPPARPPAGRRRCGRLVVVVLALAPLSRRYLTSLARFFRVKTGGVEQRFALSQPDHLTTPVLSSLLSLVSSSQTGAKRLERRAIAEDVLLSAATAHFNSAPSFEEGEEVRRRGAGRGGAAKKVDCDAQEISARSLLRIVLALRWLARETALLESVASCFLPRPLCAALVCLISFLRYISALCLWYEGRFVARQTNEERGVPLSPRLGLLPLFPQAWLQQSTPKRTLGVWYRDPGKQRTVFSLSTRKITQRLGQQLQTLLPRQKFSLPPPPPCWWVLGVDELTPTPPTNTVTRTTAPGVSAMAGPAAVVVSKPGPRAAAARRREARARPGRRRPGPSPAPTSSRPRRR